MFLLQSFQFHSQLALSDFAVRENLEVGGETQVRAHRDEPFCRIILIPLDGISIVHRELVMKIVIPFSESNKSSDKMVPRGQFIIERRLPEPVRDGIDAKNRL